MTPRNISRAHFLQSDTSHNHYVATAFSLVGMLVLFIIVSACVKSKRSRHRQTHARPAQFSNPAFNYGAAESNSELQTENTASSGFKETQLDDWNVPGSRWIASSGANSNLFYSLNNEDEDDDLLV